MAEPRRPENGLSTEAVTVLLAQYRECSAQHMLSYSLTWQVPVVTIGVAGFLAAATFGYDVPDAIRAIVVALGTLFVLAMTIAVERNRVLQLHRRRDLEAIERRLASLDIPPVEWDVSRMAREAETGRFRLYRFEFFRFLRGLMYLLIALLFVLFGLSLADAVGADIVS